MNLKSLAAALLVGVSSTARYGRRPSLAQRLLRRLCTRRSDVHLDRFLRRSSGWRRVGQALGANNGANARWLAPLFPVCATWVGYGVNQGWNTKSGFVGGGNLGYNWQIGSFRPRPRRRPGRRFGLVGFAPWFDPRPSRLRDRPRPCSLTTGGFAFLSRSLEQLRRWGATGGGNTSSSRTGWTVGAGLEYAFRRTGRLASSTVTLSSAATRATPATSVTSGVATPKVTENAVRASIRSITSGAPAAPVVAKY